MPPSEPRPIRTPQADASETPRAERVGELLQEHIPTVHRYVQRRMGTALRQNESASDIVQSVCREVIQDLDDVPQVLESSRDFRQWLLVTAARKLVNRSRYTKADKRNPGHQILSLDHAPTEGEASVDPPDDAAPPENAVALGEEMRRLEGALGDLPDEYRQVFHWRHVLGISRPEIAKRLGKSPNAVSKLLGRATARLARELRTLEPSPRS